MLQKWGDPLPEGYKARPKLTAGLTFYLEAFWELSTDRPLTMGGEGTIPWSAVQRYASFHRIADFARLLSIIRALDGEYLRIRSANAENRAAYLRRQAEEERAKPKAKPLQ